MTGTPDTPARPAAMRAVVDTNVVISALVFGCRLAWLRQARALGGSAADLGTSVKVGCHTFRMTGISTYLESGGTLDNVQAMAAHESPRTIKLYDPTGDKITLDEVGRISI